MKGLQGYGRTANIVVRVLVCGLPQLSDVAGYVSERPPFPECRLSTCIEFAESLGPLILNGITEVAARGDLLDRAILVHQPPILDGDRRSEDEFWRAFDTDRPRILGALFDVLAAAVGGERATVLPRLPRMADPVRWVTAAEPALGWVQGAFLGAYQASRQEGQDIALEAEPVAGPLIELSRRGEWIGTPSQLLAALTAIADERTTRQRGWPKTARAMTAALKRLGPNLRTAGVDWTRLGRTEKGRWIAIRSTTDTTVRTVSEAAPVTGSHPVAFAPPLFDGVSGVALYDGPDDPDDPDDLAEREGEPAWVDVLPDGPARIDHEVRGLLP